MRVYICWPSGHSLLHVFLFDINSLVFICQEEIRRMPSKFELHRQIQRKIASSKNRVETLGGVPALETSGHFLQIQIPPTSDYPVICAGMQQWFLLHHPIFSRQLRLQI